MSGMRRGTDIPVTLKRLPQGIDIKRLDFAQNGNIVITKFHDDITIEETPSEQGVIVTGYTLITQKEALKLEEKRVVEIQLSYYLGNLACRTEIATIPAKRILYNGEI